MPSKERTARKPVTPMEPARQRGAGWRGAGWGGKADL